MDSSTGPTLNSTMVLRRMAVMRARRWAPTMSSAARSTASRSAYALTRGNAMDSMMPMMTSTRTSSRSEAPRRMADRLPVRRRHGGT
jgi:hypothetical protein